jgi:cell division protein FtsL
MEEGGMKRQGNGAIRTSVAFALLFAALSLVVWRQSRALEELRGLDAARSERTILQAERAELQREIHRLESRSRVVATAGTRLGLRLPAAHEIVFLHAVEVEYGAQPGPTTGRRDLLTTAEPR